MSQSPIVSGFYDPRTFSLQYVVACPRTRRCAIVDPVLDFDEKSGVTATASADAILAHVREAGLEVEWILDTHPHADHLSAADYLKHRTGAPTATGTHVRAVQALWQRIYDWPELACDGSQWDRLFADGDAFGIGALDARVMHSPGHTLASITLVVGDAAFMHDTLFMPDSGTARCDFPGGDAWSALRFHPGDTRAARDDAPVHRPRLSAGRSRAGLREHGGQAESGEHPSRTGPEPRSVRRLARDARPHAADAAAHPACFAGQPAGRAPAGVERRGAAISAAPWG